MQGSVSVVICVASCCRKLREKPGSIYRYLGDILLSEGLKVLSFSLDTYKGGFLFFLNIYFLVQWLFG